MIERTLFDSEHEEYRRQMRRFLEDEVMPHHDRWESQQHVDREIWTRAGELGHLCQTMPSEYGGMDADRLFAVVQMEETARIGATGLGFNLHSNIVANYINNFGNDAQKQKYLPRMATGEMIGAIAMTEPGTGSDLQAVKTSAKLDGDHYVLNGSKTFITNGYMADLVVVVCKTDTAAEGAKSISLLIVEADTPGFTKNPPLKKIGQKAQDTCELFFDNVRVPKENLLGAEGQGFIMLMKELAWERLILAIDAVALADSMLEQTLAYTRERKVFGKPVESFQNSRFKLADIKAAISVSRVFVDRCIGLMMDGALTPEDAAIAKLTATEMVCKVVDDCVQLHGGYGYMLEYPVAKAYTDIRASRIYGGTNEIMKELIARSL